MDCKKIIVDTCTLLDKKLQEFFSSQSKAIKFIDNQGDINYSEIWLVEWACKYFSQNCLDKDISINLDSDIDDAEVLFETLFNGSLKLFKHKRIDMDYGITINGNVCIPKRDTHTQSLYTHSFNLAVLALNNCTGLTKQEIGNANEHCQYQELKIESLSLQELIIYNIHYSGISLISDILNKSKDTLSSIEFDGVDLSPLRNSTQLRQLTIIYDTPINHANLEVIRTFPNLEALDTGENRIVAQFNESQTLKILRWQNRIDQIEDLQYPCDPEQIKYVLLIPDQELDILIGFPLKICKCKCTLWYRELYLRGIFYNWETLIKSEYVP
ncbi:hypothetical protein FGO68_gene8263 [Halteria grandinella]|uniref:Leucine-rich repeat domain-containing protein n=1 Tax=Halteria grandinella TaxID=5974 RepID=A0A8J8T7C8_HALGN|nr:hypothetical protein FGO68_gene8263 [Halteria grandinella]